MTSVSAIRDGIKDRLTLISGLQAHDTVPGNITPPAAVVRRRQTSFDSTMARGSDDYQFTVTLLVSQASWEHGQDNLDDYLASSGSLSIKATIEGDMSLGGTVDFVRVASAGEDSIVEYNGVPYIAVDFTLEVTADGS